MALSGVQYVSVTRVLSSSRVVSLVMLLVSIGGITNLLSKIEIGKIDPDEQLLDVFFFKENGKMNNYLPKSENAVTREFCTASAVLSSCSVVQSI